MVCVGGRYICRLYNCKYVPHFPLRGGTGPWVVFTSTTQVPCVALKYSLRSHAWTYKVAVWTCKVDVGCTVCHLGVIV